MAAYYLRGHCVQASRISRARGPREGDPACLLYEFVPQLSREAGRPRTDVSVVAINTHRSHSHRVRRLGRTHRGSERGQRDRGTGYSAPCAGASPSK